MIQYGTRCGAPFGYRALPFPRTVQRERVGQSDFFASTSSRSNEERGTKNPNSELRTSGIAGGVWSDARGQERKGLRDIFHRHLLGLAEERLRTDRKSVDLQNSGNQLSGRREACPQFAIEFIFLLLGYQGLRGGFRSVGRKILSCSSNCSDSRKLYFL